MEIKRNINNIHDKSYKDLLSNKEVFAEMIKTFIDKSWAKDIKPSDLTLINKEFILSDYEELESDIVYRINDGEQDIYFYILMELQSKVDYSMPIRLFLYIGEIYRDIIKNIDSETIKNKSFRLPAVVPIVLYNGEYNWTAERQFRDIIYNATKFGNNIINFEYLLLDVNRYNRDKLRELGNLSAAIFMLDQKVTPLEFVDRIIEVSLYFDKLSEENKMILRHWLRNILDEKFKTKLKIDDILYADKEEIVKMTSNISKTLREEYDKARNEGMKKGIEQGIEQGIERGIERGIEQGIGKGIEIGKGDLLIRQLNKKFNSLSQEYILKIKKLPDAKLEILGDAIFDISTINDLDKYLN